MTGLPFKNADSVASARILASATGPLCLPNLKRASPKTLAALIRREDIAIPDIDTPELIAEPDGSATDEGGGRRIDPEKENPLLESPQTTDTTVDAAIDPAPG